MSCSQSLPRQVVDGWYRPSPAAVLTPGPSFWLLVAPPPITTCIQLRGRKARAQSGAPASANARPRHGTSHFPSPPSCQSSVVWPLLSAREAGQCLLVTCREGKPHVDCDRQLTVSATCSGLLQRLSTRNGMNVQTHLVVGRREQHHYLGL